MDEATRFLKGEWETQWTGNSSAKWLEEIRSALWDSVPDVMEEDFQMSAEPAAKVMSKMRNWSAPSPDRLVNLWSRNRPEVIKSFQAIVNGDQGIPLWFTERKTSLIPNRVNSQVFKHNL